MAHGTFQVGDLTAVIGDNAAHEKHRKGYNGLWSLKHKTGSRSIFVPGIAGLNLEHIFDGGSIEDRDVFFEPRVAPMQYRKISDSEAELHQPPTPTYRLESWTRFKLRAPHYIDMTFRCRATQHAFKQDWIGLFWASYINAPLDKSIYFRGGWPNRLGLWSQLVSQEHNDECTILHRDDKKALNYDPGRDALFKNYSRMVYEEPFYYGNFEDHTWITMFDRPEEVRFTHSPSGGGTNKLLQTTNPAWDFQWIIPDYEVNTDYTLRIRAVLRERCSREKIQQEFKDWDPQGA
ncbi:MAG: hypothetical protein CMO80_04825 [Verrucomicrobiales bacterium]|nr:hypothetical protein [Verrucomicrobiales bacterium]